MSLMQGIDKQEGATQYNGDAQRYDLVTIEGTVPLAGSMGWTLWSQNSPWDKRQLSNLLLLVLHPPVHVCSHHAAAHAILA